MHSVRICKWMAFAAAFMAVMDFILDMIIFMPRSDYRTMNGTVCGHNLIMTEDGNVWEYETEMPIYAHTDADGWTWLQSYGTTVCGIKGNEFVRRWYGYSATTQRHVNAFLDLFGKGNYSGKANWCAMPIGQIITL